MIYGYAKHQYMAKIEALELYQNQLKSHLDTLESYREQIYDFWNDAEARKVYTTLNKTTQNVRTMMDRVTEALVMHKKNVETMDSTKSVADDVLEKGISAITSLGK